VNLHLFPSINATVKSLYSLPALPFTVGLSVLSRYMNMSAKRMTFGVTCVVDNIVRTHFLNVAVGMASGAIRSTGEELGVQFSAFRRVSVVSNQKRQVNYNAISTSIFASSGCSIPVLPALQYCFHSQVELLAHSSGSIPCEGQPPVLSLRPHLWPHYVTGRHTVETPSCWPCFPV
jgi:hypothetical protein